MTQDEGKQEEDKLEFTPQGETFGYISMDQARVLAMQTARQTPGEYGRRFAEILMAFDVVEENETEDYYEVTLSFRPQGAFTGTPGQEQFFIEKEGSVAHRQVLSFPVVARRRLPVIPAAIVLVVVLTVVGAAIYWGSGGEQNADIPVSSFVPIDGEVSTTVPVAASTVSPRTTPLPLAGSAPTSAPASTAAPASRATATPITKPSLFPTPTPLRIAPPTPTFVPSGDLIRGATISGRVIDVDTSLPIANVIMRADDLATRRGPRADTGPDGRYSLGGLAPGVYSVSADGLTKGYIRKNYDDTVTRDDAARFAVTGTEVVEGIDFGLKRGANISGRVIDAVTGLPIAKMDVKAIHADGDEISWGQTGIDGRYTLKGIPDGMVEVIVVGQGYLQRSKIVMVRNGQDVTDIDF